MSVSTDLSETNVYIVYILHIQISVSSHLQGQCPHAFSALLPSLRPRSVTVSGRGAAMFCLKGGAVFRQQLVLRPPGP